MTDRGINLALYLNGWSWKHEHSFGKKNNGEISKRILRRKLTHPWEIRVNDKIFPAIAC